MELAGKIVVVTGAAAGIGAALVKKFRAAGAREVIEVDRAPGGRVVDVSDARAVAALVDEVERTVGPIDLWVGNAGILPVDPDQGNVASLPEAEWNRAWAVNVMAHVHAAAALVPRMKQRGGGYFLNTVSAAGLLSQIGAAAYSTTKHAAIGFAESLAITHRDDNIKVSVLCPQAVETPMIHGQPMNGADIDGVVTPEHVADVTIEGLRAETFLILPHPNVATYVLKKAENYDRWLGGMAKLRRTLQSSR